MKRATLLHNPTSGEEAPRTEDMAGVLEGLGYETACHSTKEDGWKEALEDPGDLVVSAGGDGTVYKVAKRLLGRGVPIAVLPEGTANNFASSLGLDGDPVAVLERLEDARRVMVDVGLVRGWPDEERFFEACGIGLFAREIVAAEAEVLPEPESADREVRRDMRLLQSTLAAVEPTYVKVIADGEDLSGEYLAVEVANLPSVGPNIRLAPEADPTDGFLDLVLVAESDRDAFEQLLEGGPEPADYPTRRVRQVELESERGLFRLDDEILEAAPDEPVRLAITLERGALVILVPAEEQEG